MNTTLQVTTPSDREIRITRAFAAPRRLVFDCMTKPELIKRWLSGPPGWTMTECVFDRRVGGKYRYAWSNTNGSSMAMGGVIREYVQPEKLVATERFDDAWYPGEALDTTVLAETDGVTTMTLTVLYESREARDMALQSGMTTGLEAGYDRLAELLSTLS